MQTPAAPFVPCPRSIVPNSRTTRWWRTATLCFLLALAVPSTVKPQSINADGVLLPPEVPPASQDAGADSFDPQTPNPPDKGAPTEQYGVASDGTLLHWNVYTPTTPGPW